MSNHPNMGSSYPFLVQRNTLSFLSVVSPDGTILAWYEPDQKAEAYEEAHARKRCLLAGVRYFAEDIL